MSVAVRCASMTTVLGGFQHHIPWVVYACVEELNRTGQLLSSLAIIEYLAAYAPPSTS